MKITELQAKLEEIKQKYGDVEVVVTDGYECVGYRGEFGVCEFQEDDGEWVADIGVGGLREGG